jgi:hypothetical protein
MKIHCGVCKVELNDEDPIIMDKINGLTHSDCYQLNKNFIKDEGNFKVIKEKYWFFQDENSN